MRINRRQNSAEKAGALHQELSGLCATTFQQWPVCGPRCPSSDPRPCRSDCPDIPRALSDDPDANPLEALVAPLVYELHRLDGYQTCWSCEGHDRFGELWEKPQVWFYTEHQVHVRVLSEALTALHLKKALRAEWEVVVTYSDPDNPDTTYALRPRQDGAPARLDELRIDLATMAKVLVDQCRRSAADLRASAA